MNKQEEYKTCDLCGLHHSLKVCECGEFSDELKNLLKEARGFRMEKFKEKDKSISNALHIPYSGMGDPDYVHMSDFIKDDVCSLIVEFFENTDDEILTVEELSEAIENIDDNGSMHEHIESSLTWQQGLIDSGKIINYFSEYEDTDSGLWEGQQPEEAINTKAFFTYKNAVQSEMQDFIKEYEE